MNNDFKMDDNGEIEVQIAPVGEFCGSNAKGEPVAETITPEGLSRLAEKLNSSEEEILVDVDHASARPGLDRDTRAVGWLSRFYSSVKGLFAKMKLTSFGKDLVKGRDYRYLSPVFTLDENGEPDELHSVAFTNTPAFAGSIDPIVNHAPAKKQEPENKDTIKMEMTKDELTTLIRETVLAMNAAPVEKKDEPKAEEKPACNEAPAEEKKEEACNECGEKKDEEKPVVENAETEKPVEQPKAEEKPEEKPVEQKKEDEDKEDEDKDEVIKLETLNSAPAVSLEGDDSWKDLHGDKFWEYLRKNPRA